MSLIYKSKPFYIILIGVIISNFLLPLLDYKKGISIKIEDVIGVVVITYLAGFFTIISFRFYDDCFYRVYPFRKYFFFYKKKYDYSKLYMVEIKDVVESHANPTLILHFNIKKIKSIFYFRRAFFYNKYNDIEPLIIFLLSKGVKVKNNIQRSSYDAKQLNDLIKEYKE